MKVTVGHHFDDLWITEEGTFLQALYKPNPSGGADLKILVLLPSKEQPGKSYVASYDATAVVFLED